MMFFYFILFHFTNKYLQLGNLHFRPPPAPPFPPPRRITASTNGRHVTPSPQPKNGRDRSSREGGVETGTIRVSCLQSLSLCSVWFFCLGLLVWYGSLQWQWPIHLKTGSTSFNSIEITSQKLKVRNHWRWRCRGRGGIWSCWSVRGSKSQALIGVFLMSGLFFYN